MGTWDIIAYGKDHAYLLKAEVYYHSNQIMKIKVFGKTNSIGLQNDYPLKKRFPIKWKLIDGKLIDHSLLASIIKELERLIKNDFSGKLLNE